WNEYFDLATEAQTHSALIVRLHYRKQLKQTFWHAHDYSIRYALWRHENEMLLNRAELPREEWNYWANWIGIVEYLQKINFATTDSFIFPIVTISSPRCSPLGETACVNEIAHDFIRREYTQTLGNADIDLEQVR